MDKRKVSKIVNKHLKFLRWAMQLQDWTITMLYERLGDGRIKDKVRQAECESDPLYKHATITIDPEHHSSESDVLDTLLHELAHLMHADFALYRRQVEQCVGDECFRTLDEAWALGAERTVAAIVGMLQHGLRLDTRGMIKLSRKSEV